MPNFCRGTRSTSASAHWRAVTAAAVLVLLIIGVSGVVAAAPAGSAAPGQKPRVLTVGTFDGKPGEFQSIQAAVDAASPGDWIVIAPGDYKERGDYTTHPPDWAPTAGVFIDKPDLHLLGLSRGGVVVDGTKSRPPCSASPADQDRGPAGPSGPWGRNGIEVFEASGVTIQNMLPRQQQPRRAGQRTRPGRGRLPGARRQE